jgi:hypothetical protein
MEMNWMMPLSVPVGCHSHNDYWRRVPLYSALQAGCIGVEADVWLFGFWRSRMVTSGLMYMDCRVRCSVRDEVV